MKRVWMIYPYGQIEGEQGRESRYNLFGKELSRNGYKVIWWTANFDHGTKEYRYKGWKRISVNDRFSTILVPSSPYKRNVSFRRIFFEKEFARNLKRGFNKAKKPDAIIVASTGMFNAFEPCASYAKKNNIPIIYDIMDIPLIETYFAQHHKILLPVAKVVMATERIREETFFDNISGITALGKNQLNHARKRAHNRNIPSALIYNGNDVVMLRQNINANKRKLSIHKEQGWTWIVFSGSLGPSYDIETILECADKCRKNHDKIKFVIAGRGPQESKIIEHTKNNPNLEYFGMLSMEELAELYSYCDIGLCAFTNCSTVDMPDKFYDYCAAGLAILNTLQGEVKTIIHDKNLGFQYDPGNVDSLYEKVILLSQNDTLEIFKKNSYDIGMNFDQHIQMKKISGLVKQVINK